MNPDKIKTTTVSSRVPVELKDRLLEKWSKPGDISKLILLLLQKAINGKIIGIKLEG
jgi:hypothetical protein